MTYRSASISGTRLLNKYLPLLLGSAVIACSQPENSPEAVLLAEVIQETETPCEVNVNHGWLEVSADHSKQLCNRIAPPAGFKRTALPASSFGEWLRHLPLKEQGAQVYLYNGSLKSAQDLHLAVVDIDRGKKDLQQCADAVMRLRAEYLWATGRPQDVSFNYTSGDPIPYARWMNGERPVVKGNSVQWQQRTKGSGHADFRNYMDNIFMYAGTSSLAKELVPAGEPAAGDVFILPGFPGHAVILVDEAINQQGEKVFLAAQSYMPAQDIHLVKNFEQPELKGWYSFSPGKPVAFPEWVFNYDQLKRFRN